VSSLLKTSLTESFATSQGSFSATTEAEDDPDFLEALHILGIDTRGMMLGNSQSSIDHHGIANPQEPKLRKVILSWSSGKDSTWVLHLLCQQPDVEVVALFTTFNSVAYRVAMHAVRRVCFSLEAQHPNAFVLALLGGDSIREHSPTHDPQLKSHARMAR
jgi:hypothetical protein